MTLSKNKLGIDKGINGLYVHCNPPRILSVSAAHIKQLIRNGDIEKLEQLVYEGQGKKLIGEYSADYKTRTFLKSVPALMSKIALLHDSLNSDRLSELQSILDEEPEKKRKLVMAKDRSGVGLLHKAVYYDLKSIYRWLIDKFPHLVNLKDSEGRTPYFYTLMCKEPLAVQKLLTLAGADPNVVDYRGHTTKYYSCHLQELELPHCSKSAASRRTTASLDGLTYKKSNIRIWIHQRNMANLQQVIWDGHGSKLLVEHSNNAKMRKFLDAVPYIMGVIKDVHCDVHNGDLDSLINRVTPPVPSAVLKSKDRNGLTPLHKAVGLGKKDMATYIIDTVPESVKAVDNEGRTPLHYAAILKDDQKMFNFLISRGADESTLDNKQKTAAYYRTRASELDTKVLNTIPECPRGAKEPNSFDWCMLSSAEPVLMSNGLIHRKSKDKSDNEMPAKIIMPDKRSNSEEKPLEAPEPPQEEIHDIHTEVQEMIDENHNGHQEPEQLDKSIEEPEVIPQNDITPEVVEEQPEALNEQFDNNNTEEVTSNENDESKEESNEDEHKEDEQLTPDKETKEKREDSAKSLAKSQHSEEEKSNDSRPPSTENRNGEHLEEDTEGEGVIEGIVNGEDEVEPVNNEGPRRPPTEDEDVKSLIESGNMEQLAALVLNGHGDKLVGESSDNPELQAFLDNVPVYMSKINRIHQAAQEGILRDLQAALDRRKFAVARDKISPNGATPLHVAVVFGRTSIVRYLAGRFPETLHVEDDNGRTPLHYAAVIRDNGHYYNLLTHLGADNRIKDKFGRTPVYYTKIQTDFNHQKLLKEFGVEVNEDEDQINNKDDLYSACKTLDDEDMITVLDKCYVVIHGRRNSLFSAVSVPNLSTVKNLNKRPPPTIVSKQLKRTIFDKIKLRITKLDHNLYDVIWPSVKKLPSEPSLRMALEADFPLGIVAPDFCVYKVFQEFLDPVIKEFNCMDINRKFSRHPPTNFLQNGAEVYIDLDQSGSLIMTDNLPNTEDKEDNGQIDMPFFATEEGRYLASSLGDPLIKGLTEVANKRPEDPIAYLATYLYNFARTNPEEKSNVLPQEDHNQRITDGTVNPTVSVPTSIDVVTVEPNDNEIDVESAFSSTTRDEHGQSMLHFAAARSHGRNALFQLLLETDINIAYRDELYRTARDISIQANIPENTVEIDRYVLHIASNGDTNKLVELLLDGYDHITDIVDEKDVSIVDVVANANQSETVTFLQSILTFEEKRERVHHSIRQGSITEVMTLLADENDTGSGKLLAIGKNTYGRCSLHIAVLCQQEEIVDYLAITFPDTLRIGDNLERTALHYAMGVEKMESITRVLIKAGAKRIIKDLKGRQPTYYFLNKTDILRLQEEEETI